MSAHLHSTCATDFDVWISDSDLCETELNEALRILEIKRSNLWTPGHDDSYYRNRYDLDALYVERMNKIKERLAKCWMSSAVPARSKSPEAPDPVLALVPDLGRIGSRLYFGPLGESIDLPITWSVNVSFTMMADWLVSATEDLVPVKSTQRRNELLARVGVVLSHYDL